MKTFLLFLVGGAVAGAVALLVAETVVNVDSSARDLAAIRKCVCGD